MKKKVVMILTVAVVLSFAGMIGFMRNSKADNSVVEEEKDSNSYTNEWNESVETFNKMVPIFTALGAETFTEDLAYYWRRDFYSKSFPYLVAYSKDLQKFEITEEENCYKVSYGSMLALESTAFYGGSFNIGTLDDGENFDDSAVYDERNNIYLVGKKEIPMDYSLTITSAKGKQYVDDGRFDEPIYTVNAKLYKSGEYVDDLIFTLRENICTYAENAEIYYTVENMETVNHKIMGGL